MAVATATESRTLATSEPPWQSGCLSTIAVRLPTMTVLELDYWARVRVAAHRD